MMDEAISKEEIRDAEIAHMSFEAAMAKLEHIIGRLENADVGLEQSIALYRQGVSLKAHCEKKLREAEADIQKLSLDKDQNPTARQAFDNE